MRGEVKLWSYTADPLALADYGELFTADGTRRFTIEALRPGKEFLVARLKGINDRSAAERLRHLELFVPRERLPPTEDDEFYHADLVGLTAVDAGGVEIGRVVAVHNFGAGDLLELKRKEDGQTFMLPFTDATVPAVDVAGGRIVVALMKGVLSLGKPATETPPPLRGRSAAKREGGG